MNRLRFTKESNTEVKEYTEHAERKSLAEKILGRGTDNASGRFGPRLKAVTANQHDRRAFGLVHEQSGGGG